MLTLALLLASPNAEATQVHYTSYGGHSYAFSDESVPFVSMHGSDGVAEHCADLGMGWEAPRMETFSEAWWFNHTVFGTQGGKPGYYESDAWSGDVTIWWLAYLYPPAAPGYTYKTQFAYPYFVSVPHTHYLKWTCERPY